MTDPKIVFVELISNDESVVEAFQGAESYRIAIASTDKGTNLKVVEEKLKGKSDSLSQILDSHIHVFKQDIEGRMIAIGRNSPLKHNSTIKCDIRKPLSAINVQGNHLAIE